MIEAGKLRYRITVKRNTNSADGYGGFTSSLSTIGTYWGDRKYLDGKKQRIIAETLLNQKRIEVGRNTALSKTYEIKKRLTKSTHT